MANKKGFLAGLAAMLGGMVSSSVVEVSDRRRYTKKKERTPEEIAAFEENRKMKQGLKRFYYGDKYVIALNQKNADRKARQQGIIS